MLTSFRAAPLSVFLTLFLYKSFSSFSFSSSSSSSFFCLLLLLLLLFCLSLFHRLMDCVLLIAGAAVMGVIVGPTTKDSMTDTGSLLLNHLMIVLVFGTLSTISSLPTFSQSKLMFWRESSQDVSILSIWLSRNVTDLVFILLQTLGFVGIVYDMTMPLMSLQSYYFIYVAVGFSNSGLGYFLSTFIPRRNLTLYSALLAVLIGAFFSGTLPYLFELREQIIQGTSSSAAVKLGITEISYSRWSVEALVTTEIMMAPPGIISTYGVETFETSGFACLNVMYTNETVESYEKPFERLTQDFLMPDNKARVPGQPLYRNLWPLFWIGLVCRILALLGLYTFDRKQQNKLSACDIFLGWLCCRPCRSSSGSSPAPTADESTRARKKKTRLGQKSFFSFDDPITMVPNPSFGGKDGATEEDLLQEQKLREMYTAAIDATTGRTTVHNEQLGRMQSVIDEADSWAERVQGHGESSRIRQQKNRSRMAMLFDIWDKVNDGILDEGDMAAITRNLQNKVYAQFGDAESRQRLKNVGHVTPDTFNQFFEWFVVQPTVNKIYQTVQKSHPSMTVKDLKRRRRQSIMQQFQLRPENSGIESSGNGAPTVNRSARKRSMATKTAWERRRQLNTEKIEEAKNAEEKVETKGDGGATAPKKRVSKPKKRIDRKVSSVYEPSHDVLPKNWTEFFDPKKSLPYYYNHETSLTTWKRP